MLLASTKLAETHMHVPVQVRQYVERSMVATTALACTGPAHCAAGVLRRRLVHVHTYSLQNTEPHLVKCKQMKSAEHVSADVLPSMREIMRNDPTWIAGTYHFRR